ncbi:MULTISPECIES: hypothetical protein [Streptomyces]|uniref:Uncharacterized protein n=1 Tax=Streptomyces harbinensis TaxID=1176198 RepID=A0A1I6WA91_9ACTN|nr:MULTISPECIES: hypothetical protein [Streptomyces]SFT22913.1 hypothetical protein SAMN05444716_1166 [Streptomyces harbinensis]
MAATTAPTARKRPRRTRTKRVSLLPALQLSQLLPQHIDLRNPLRAVLVCPDCKTWCPITGIQARVQKLVPHHTGRAGVAAATRCRGSNRRIEWDMTIPEWREALEDAIQQTASRRPTQVTPKPTATPAPAVSQIAALKQQPQASDGDGEEAGDRLNWLVREMGWARTEQAVRETDARRAQIPASNVPERPSPVPLETLRPRRRAH